MKRLLIAAGLLCAMTVNAQVQWLSADIQSKQLGTGTPTKRITIGDESAFLVNDGYYHIPQYMAQFPTSATLWARVVEVQCDEDVAANTMKCDGYHWSPALGRGEYLMFTPKLREKPAAPPAQCCTAPETKIITILKEVPVKGKGG